MRGIFLSAATALFILPTAVAAQAGAPPSGPSVPSGAPGQNPYARPDGVDARDLSMTAADRMALDQRAADARAAAVARGGRAVPAKPSDIVAEAAISDSAGLPVGTIESVDADGAVVATAAGRVKIPLQAFGKNNRGLLLGITKREFEALVAKANAQPVG